MKEDIYFIGRFNLLKLTMKHLQQRLSQQRITCMEEMKTGVKNMHMLS